MDGSRYPEQGDGKNGGGRTKKESLAGLQEFDYDISGGFTEVDRSGFPLSMIIRGRMSDGHAGI